MHFFISLEDHNLPCIYEIRNRLSKKSYIGSTFTFRKRVKGHRRDLLKNKHPNKHLQNSFNFYYEKIENDNFIEFHLVEEMPNSTKKQRLAREEYWINFAIKNKIQLYNQRLKPTIESELWVMGEEGKESIANHNSKEYALHSPDGIEFRGKNIAKFAKEQNLDVRGFSELLLNKAKSYKGWTKILTKEDEEFFEKKQKDIFEKQSMHAKSNWQKEEYREKHSIAVKEALKDPEQRRQRSVNMKLIWQDEEYRENFNHKIHEAYDKRPELLKAKSETLKKRIQDDPSFHRKAYEARMKNVSYPALQDSNGIVFYNIKNLTIFCQEHNLDLSNISSIINGSRISHKGWRLYKSE